MSFKKKNCIRGELLRSMREAQDMDITWLSRQVNLSVAQLRQLESDKLAPGERSLFYSEAIKANASQKVALTLGADPSQLVVEYPIEDVTLNDAPEMQTLDDLAQLLAMQKQAEKAKLNKHRRIFWRWRLIWTGLALGLLGALGWHFQNPLIEKGRSWMTVFELSAPVEVAAVPPVIEPVVAEVTAAPTSDDVKISSTESSCAQQVSATVLKPSMPSKAGNMVYIMAEADAFVCMQDAKGKKFEVNFKAHESRSFYGSAPWKVQVDKASSVQLFFQGQRLRWPEGEQMSFILQETEGNY